MPNIVAQKAQTTPPTVVRSPIDELVPKSEKCTVEIANIVLEDGMQMRASLCVDIVEEYAELIKAGKTFPPVVLYRLPSGELLLASGFHRVAAYKRAGKAQIPAIIQDGSRRDAVRHAIGSNSQHGLRMSHQDKRRAVKAALREFPELSDHKIADLVGVTQPFV